MKEFRSNGVRAMAICLACVAATRLATGSEPAWDYRPYKVSVRVVLPDRPELPAAAHAAWRERLAAQLQSVYAPLWETQVADVPPALRPRVVDDIDGLSARDISRDTVDGDKLLLVSVVAGLSAWTLCARDYDCTTGTLSAGVTASSRPEQLLDATSTLLAKAFAPLARVDVERSGDRLLLRPRGGQLRPREAPAGLAVGDACRLYARGGDRQSPATAVPWTFCEVTDVGTDEIAARLVSGAEDPLAGARGIGIERLALQAVVTSRPTMLRVVTPGSPAAPVVGCAVFDATEPNQPTSLGLTDRAGAIAIAPTKRPLRVLTVGDGGRTVARFPFLPGADREATLELSGGNPAIETELYIAGLRDGLVDMLARRQMLVSRTETAIKAKQWDDAERLVAEFSKLPAAKEIVVSLMQQRGRPSAIDAVGQTRVDAFVAEAQKTLELQCDSQRVRQWQEKIAAARKPAATPPANPAQP